ncbi:MAG: hemolysin family protein [Polyangiaceae bacterium]
MPASLHPEGATILLPEVLVIVLLIVVQGAFAGAEIAVVSVRKTRLEQLVQEKRSGAKSLKRLRKDPEVFLAAVQIAATVVTASASAFGGASIAKHLEPSIARLPGVDGSADKISLAIVIGVLSYFTLVIGELVPKSLALRSAEPYALFLSRPLLAVSIVAKPLVWFLTTSSNVVLRLFGDKTNFSEARLNPGEIQQLVDEATETGAVDPRAGEIASRAIDFADLLTGQVMVPRQKVVGIPRDANADAVRRIVMEHGKTRMPVFDGVIDDVVGYVTIRDLMALLIDQQLFVFEDLIRPAFKVRESMRAVDLLSEMRKRRIQLAIVVDTQGAMQGIVTLEDLVEELVGEIASEHEEVEPDPIQRDSGGWIYVRGDVAIRDVNRQLELDLPEGDSWTTIAGLCLELAGHIPRAGERFTAEDGTDIEVVAASPRQVKRVKLRPNRRNSEE